MKLKELLKSFSYDDIEDIEDIEIDKITYNSEEVVPKTFFVCKGKTFKEEYLRSAIEKGAVCYMSEKSYPEIKAPCVKEFLVKDIRIAMAKLAETFYRKPWNDIGVIGITGTKGKSTTAHLMKSVLDEFVKNDTAIISSIKTYNGKEKFKSLLSTPEAFDLFRHIRTAADFKIPYITTEVSSQALKYHRTLGIDFKIGIFLNISEDHISPSEHGNFEDYFSSKLKIFEQTENAVVNLSSNFSERILNEAEKCKNMVSFSSYGDVGADFTAYNFRKTETCTLFEVKAENEYSGEYELGISGFFNIENAMAVIAAASIIKIPPNVVKAGLKKASIEGRAEIIKSKDEKTVAVIDYAHNKLSFEKLFSSMRDEYPDYKIKAVFGVPGGKAYNRRKELGEIAGRYCKKVYLTEDDPNFESVEKICAEIAEHISSDFEIIPDREEAIKKAFEEAEGKTLIVIAGKGEETSQKSRGKLVPYKSDLKIAKELI